MPLAISAAKPSALANTAIWMVREPNQPYWVPWSRAYCIAETASTRKPNPVQSMLRARVLDSGTMIQVPRKATMPIGTLMKKVQRQLSTCVR